MRVYEVQRKADQGSRRWWRSGMRWRSDVCVETTLVRRAWGTGHRLAVDSEWMTDRLVLAFHHHHHQQHQFNHHFPSSMAAIFAKLHLTVQTVELGIQKLTFLSRSWLWMRLLILTQNFGLSSSSSSRIGCSEASNSTSAPNVAKASSAREKKWEMECAMNLLTGHRSFTAICRHKTIVLHTPTVQHIRLYQLDRPTYTIQGSDPSLAKIPPDFRHLKGYPMRISMDSVGVPYGYRGIPLDICVPHWNSMAFSCV